MKGQIDTSVWRFILNDNGNYTIIGYIGPVTDIIQTPTEHNGKPVDKIHRLDDIPDVTFKNIRNLIISEGIISIHSRSFINCNILESVTVPDSVVKMGEDVFKGCTSLRELKIPPYIQNVSPSLLTGCVNLKKLYLPEKSVHISSDIYKDINTDIYYY